MTKLLWADFKSRAVSRALAIQMDERPTSYQLQAVDGILIYLCSVAKDGGGEQIDFETNFKSTVNRKVGSGEPQPFAVPTYQTKLDATDEIIEIPPDGSIDILYQLPFERYVTGGSLIVQNAQLGDYISAEVRDDSGLIPVPYRAALAESWPVVAEYVVKNWVEVTGEFTVMKINTYPLNAKIPQGFWLSLTYFATPIGVPRKVAVNYHLTRKL